MSQIDEDLIRRTEKFQTLEYKLWRERFQRIRRFIEHTKVAHDEGILVYVNPLQVMAQSGKTHFYSLPSVKEIPVEEVDEHLAEIIFHSIIADLNNKTFRSLVKQDFPYSEQGFAVFKDQGEINWLAMLSHSSHHKEDKMIQINTFVGENTIAPPPGVGFDSIVSPELGMAVFLSHVLSFCIRNPVYPVTDKKYYWRLLQHKFNKLSENEVIKRFEKDTKIKVSALGLELMDIELPRLAIKDFEDVLHVRLRLKDELIHFRLEVAKYSNFTSTQFWTNDFARECNDVASLKVKPAVIELQNALSLSKDKVIVDAFKMLRTVSPAIPLVSTLVAGIPIQYALAITAGLISAETFLDLYFEKKKIKTASGLSYLLDLKSKF